MHNTHDYLSLFLRLKIVLLHVQRKMGFNEPLPCYDDEFETISEISNTILFRALETFGFDVVGIPIDASAELIDYVEQWNDVNSELADAFGEDALDDVFNIVEDIPFPQELCMVYKCTLDLSSQAFDKIACLESFWWLSDSMGDVRVEDGVITLYLLESWQMLANEEVSGLFLWCDFEHFMRFVDFFLNLKQQAS